jgi:hypothetical protein
MGRVTLLSGDRYLFHDGDGDVDQVLQWMLARKQ